MADQRCGTCRWAKLDPIVSWIAECLHPIPVCVVATTVMHPGDGEHCPCYQPAPQPETEDCPDDD